MSKLTITKSRNWIERLHQRLHIDIAAHEIRVLQSGGLLRRRVLVLHRETLTENSLDNQETLLKQLHQILAGLRCNKMNVTMTIADSLARMWMVIPPQNAASLADCQAAAGLRFHALFGEFSGTWEIIADWDARRPFLASAIERSLLERLNALCAAYQLNLLQLQPQFVSVWNRFCGELQNESWMALLEHNTLTIAAVTQGRLVALRSITVLPEVLQQRSWIDQHLQRQALLLDLDVPRRLHISGVLPAQWQKHVSGQIQCLPLGQRLEGTVQ